jgi:hypothetical protein
MLFGVLFAAILIGGAIFGIQVERGEDRGSFRWGLLGIFIAFFGLIINNVIIKEETRGGPPASINQLEAGIYAVHGTLQIGSETALWIAPLTAESSKNFRTGKLYQLPKGPQPDFGPYILKLKSGELIPYRFEQ